MFYKYLYEGDVTKISSRDIVSFYKSWLEGSLSQHYKSEPIPEVNDEPLTIVVGLSWEEIVMDRTKDVFIEYYAPWCGHCMTLAPTWNELAEAAENIPDLVIAKMDATFNEVPGLEIHEFPTIIYYPKNDKKGIEYHGGHLLYDFKDYLG